MSKKNKTETGEEKKPDAETTPEERTAETIPDKEPGDGDGKTPEGDDAAAGKENKEKQIDYDAEIEAERKRGVPDPRAADEAFRSRKKKREEDADKEPDDEDDDRPLTRKDIAEIEARTERKILAGQAVAIARSLTGGHADSEKEALLVAARWSNRSFPKDMSLQEQIEEVYAGLHRKRLMGERDEALRAAAGSARANRNAATTHREPANGLEPELAPGEAQAFKAAGMSYNTTSRQWEKKLPNGDLLVRDPKTKQTRILKKAK